MTILLVGWLKCARHQRRRKSGIAPRRFANLDRWLQRADLSEAGVLTPHPGRKRVITLDEWQASGSVERLRSKLRGCDTRPFAPLSARPPRPRQGPSREAGGEDPGGPGFKSRA
jgi:hypothetical protein